LPRSKDSRIIIGHSPVEDAAVIRVSDNLALVLTVDFFTPVVDDPYAFGAIAVANALSDIYAMGGKPICGLNIVCFPLKTLSSSILNQILRGGVDKAKEAGIEIVGGHSIDDPEPKYGLCAIGTIDPEHIITKRGALPRDYLFLTKPLGTGIITTGIKQGKASEKGISEVVRLMSLLNQTAAEAAIEAGASAMTDVTGFGLLGHLWEMLESANIGARLYLKAIPILSEAKVLVKRGIFPGGTQANLEAIRPKLRVLGSISEEELLLLSDAQTSGGLLIAMSPTKVDILKKLLEGKGGYPVSLIGEILETKEAFIEIRD
jgi:selenide,water dikinase